MSTKKTDQDNSLSTIKYKHPFERPDGRSLVAVCDLRPVTMGDRVRRYTRTPELRDDQYHDEKFDPDDFDDDDRMMSPHEDRFEAHMKRRKERKAEIDKKEKERLADLEKLEFDKFRNKVNSVIKDIPKTE